MYYYDYYQDYCYSFLYDDCYSDYDYYYDYCYYCYQVHRQIGPSNTANIERLLPNARSSLQHRPKR